MQFIQDAANARPTADWITRYATDLLAATPGMHPLDAVRQAMEASAGTAIEGRKRQPSRIALRPRTVRRSGP